jgi:hypothetical protein
MGEPAMNTEVKLSRYALRTIEAYFDIGRETRFNRHEQLAALGGRIKKGVIYVDLALPLLSTNASAGHIEIKAEQWFAAIQTFAAYKLKLVGSIHSHPKGLGLFMSGADKEAHSLMFPGGVSLVINPQKRTATAFTGSGENFILRLGKEDHYDKKGNPYSSNRLGLRLRDGSGGAVQSDRGKNHIRAVRRYEVEL